LNGSIPEQLLFAELEEDVPADFSQSRRLVLVQLDALGELESGDC
jgi:hypothetical protein